jgi:hypothetical protein
MSTNGVIAMPKGLHNFLGRYHHWDSYPAGLGVTLINGKNKYFSGDVRRMIEHFVINEKAGWSTVIAYNPAGPASWDYDHEKPYPQNPQSYTARGEDERPYITRKDVYPGQYVYVLWPTGIDVHYRDIRQLKLLDFVDWDNVRGMLKLQPKTTEREAHYLCKCTSQR